MDFTTSEWKRQKEGWRSILVSTASPEDGPKNPFKGISMKFLVSACYAQ